jgi:hypothetical protein
MALRMVALVRSKNGEFVARKGSVATAGQRSATLENIVNAIVALRNAGSADEEAILESAA